MIPIRDSIPCTITPYVTWALMVLCSVIFLLMLLLPDEAAQQLLYQYGMVPVRYTHPEWAARMGFSNDFGLSFATNLFLHGGWLHLGFNLVFLWIFADNIEELMGHKRFLMFYMLCGVIATLVQWLFTPTLGIPVVGASGAIAGVLGAYFCKFPYARVLFVVPILFFPIFFELPAIAFLGFWVIMQLQNISTAALFTGVAVDSAWWAHLGGFIAGASLFRFFQNPTPPLLPDSVEPLS
jgi:membrane associated rhomboid family serine protease